MRKYLFVILVGVLSLSAIGAYASAASVTRLGIEYSGAAPTSCVIEADDLHPTELRVDCRQSEQGARVRFRFLKDVGFVRGPATVSADLHIIQGKCVIGWRSPVAHQKARTARVTVSPGGYCHLRSVTAAQP